MSLFGCSTIKPKPEPEPLPLPLTLEFPVFPDPQGFVVLRDGTVSMPLDYWMRVVVYEIDVDTAKKMYEAWKNAQNR